MVNGLYHLVSSFTLPGCGRRGVKRGADGRIRVFLAAPVSAGPAGKPIEGNDFPNPPHEVVGRTFAIGPGSQPASLPETGAAGPGQDKPMAKPGLSVPGSDQE
jgi:hypothetical protein